MWRNHLVDILGKKLGLKYSLTDAEVLYKSSTDETGLNYYTYILVYVSGILLLDKTPKHYINILEEAYTV